MSEHLELCEETYGLLLEENRYLKRAGEPAEEHLLKRKQDLLPQLEASLAAIRELRETGVSLNPERRKTAEKAQQRLMKIVLLDRENEKLLLQVSGPIGRPQLRKPMSAPASVLRDTYGNG